MAHFHQSDGPRIISQSLLQSTTTLLQAADDGLELAERFFEIQWLRIRLADSGSRRIKVSFLLCHNGDPANDGRFELVLKAPKRFLIIPNYRYNRCLA